MLWYLEADPSVVINWLEENRRPESIVDDDFLAAYCERVRPGDYLNQIVGRVKSPQIDPSEGRRQAGHLVVPGYQSQESADTMDRSIPASSLERSRPSTSSGGYKPAWY